MSQDDQMKELIQGDNVNDIVSFISDFRHLIRQDPHLELCREIKKTQSEIKSVYEKENQHFNNFVQQKCLYLKYGQILDFIFEFYK